MTLFHKKQSMKFVDIHTHNNNSDKSSSILNSNEYIAERAISIGIHPWNIDTTWKKLFATIKEQAHKENVRAIGECGIDKLKSPENIELQKEILLQLTVFIKQVLLGECTGISFVYSTPLRVCRNQRIHMHKTFHVAFPSINLVIYLVESEIKMLQ